MSKKEQGCTMPY